MAQVRGTLGKAGTSISTVLRRISFRPSRGGVLLSICLTLIVAIAVFLRILPMNWGFTLSEFDPFYHYELTQYIVDHGLGPWYPFDREIWRTYRSWYPFGRDNGLSSYPGLPMAGAGVYLLATSLGLKVTVMDVAIVFPVLAAAITCVVMFFLGKEVGGEGVGLLSALFLAVSPAYIERTNLGFYDDETVGILSLLLAILFFLRALKHEEKLSTNILYSIAAGLSLGFVFASWGAARYPLSLMALFAFLLILLKMAKTSLLITYGLMIGIGLGISTLVPRLGIGFVKEFQVLASVGVFLLLVLVYISRRLPAGLLRKVFLPSSLTALGIVALVLWERGIINLPGVKFISVLDPFRRIEIPILESVGEHRPATWASFYYQFGQFVFLAPVGIFFALRKATYSRIFFATYAVTTLYFSASMVRLTILAAPALATLGAIALTEIMRPFSDLTLQRSVSRRRLRLTPRLGRGFSVLLVVALIALTFIPIGRGIEAAYAPTTIVASSIPARSQISDWMEVLNWMKENLPKDAIVASWWDYGYWISIVAGKISLADNGTINSTQIAQLGRMFMSTENDALVILKKYDAQYVVVFTTINQAQGGQFLFGDEVKWRWMAQIGWNSTADKPLEDTTITSQLAQAWKQVTQDTALQQWYNQFAKYALPKADRVLTKLMIHGSYPGAFPALVPNRFQLVYSSSRRFVFVYKVDY